MAKPDPLKCEKQTLNCFEAGEREGLTAAPPLLAIDDVALAVRVESARHVGGVTGGHIWFWERKPRGTTGHVTQKEQQAVTDGLAPARKLLRDPAPGEAFCLLSGRDFLSSTPNLKLNTRTCLLER